MNTHPTLPRPTAVTPHENYTLDLTFNNGERRLFDATAYLEYPAFKALKATSLFMQARVAHNTVVWNEEIDMAPENLYLESK
jgi:hypothetical protein